MSYLYLWSHDLTHRLRALVYRLKRQASYDEAGETPKRPHHVTVLKSTISLAFTRQSQVNNKSTRVLRPSCQRVYNSAFE